PSPATNRSPSDVNAARLPAKRPDTPNDRCQRLLPQPVSIAANAVLVSFPPTSPSSASLAPSSTSPRKPTTPISPAGPTTTDKSASSPAVSKQRVQSTAPVFASGVSRAPALGVIV